MLRSHRPPVCPSFYFFYVRVVTSSSYEMILIYYGTLVQYITTTYHYAALASLPHNERRRGPEWERGGFAEDTDKT